MDARGFAILARLRGKYGQTESVLMDFAALETHRRWAVRVASSPLKMFGLTPNERAAVVVL